MSTQTKNKFDIICNTVDNGIVVLNKNLEVFFWNRWLETRTGIETISIVGRNILDFYPNIDKNRLQRKIITALKIKSPTFYTPQTDNFLINIEINNISDKVFNQMQQSITITPLDFEEDLVILYIYDITFLSETNYKLEVAKKELSEKNEELRLILDATMEAIIIFKDNMIIDCNKIAIELLNKKTKDDLIDKKYQDLFINKNSKNKDESEPFETTITRDDGSRFSAILNIKNTLINNQMLKILTIIDIEEIKRKESLLAEQTKLAAMGEMIGNIAHQWRQPLSVISMLSSNMKLKKDTGKLEKNELIENLQLITKTTEYLSSTIDTFNNFLKNDKEQSLFNLKDNIKNNILLVTPYFKDFNIEISLDLENDIYIFGVANEFSQAFINILNNAKDALIQNLDDDEPKIVQISSKRNNHNIEVQIKDNALGINKDIINKIFEPYFTTKHQYQGTGLGLYMTRQIITSSLKGDIKVENSYINYKNQQYFGAKFTITLPSNLD